MVLSVIIILIIQSLLIPLEKSCILLKIEDEYSKESHDANKDGEAYTQT